MRCGFYDGHTISKYPYIRIAFQRLVNMLSCSSCSKKFEVGQICENCSKLACSEHKIEFCPFCGSKLRKATLNVEKVVSLNIDWLVIEDNKQVGTVGTRILPTYFMKIWFTLKKEDSQINIILLNSKKDSIDLEKNLCEKNGLRYKQRVTRERSRYSIFSSESGKSPFLVLLNQNALNENSALFLTVLNTRLSKQSLVFNKKDDDQRKKIIKSLGNALLAYNKKMELPYLTANEVMREFLINTINNIKQCFVECKAIQELANDRIYVPALVDYLQYKLESTFTSMDFSARFIIYEALQNLEKTVLDNALIQATQNNTAAYNFLTNWVDEKNLKFKQDYAELPDLLEATDSAISAVRNLKFSTYCKYVKDITTILEHSLSKIKPEYVSLAEIVDLVKLSDTYLIGIENNEIIENHKFGSIYNYINLLDNVFMKEGIYPEIRIIAGYALEHTLMSWLLINGQNNIQLFEDYAKYTKALSILIEQHLPQILKKNPSFDDIPGSSLRYEDAADKLITLSRIAKTFGYKEIETEALEKAAKLAEKYELPSTKFSIYWTKFVETQNFDYLKLIQNLMRESKNDEILKQNFLARPIELVIEAILFNEKIDQNIDKANDLLLDSTAEGATTYSTAEAGFNTTERLYHMFEMIRELLNHQGKIENIKKAHKEALILTEILVPTDPLQIMPLKTRILYCLLSNNISSAILLIQKLAKYPDPEKCITKFLDMATLWTEIISNKEIRTFMHREEFQYNGKDIWILTLQYFVFQVMDDDFGSNIAGSRAVVFVEGITDLLVLKEFMKILETQDRLHFMELEGYSNFEHYVESRFAKQMQIPYYVIFDGDTLDEDKRKTMGPIVTPMNRIYTLKKRTIEDYLLNSKAIVRAYPEKALNETTIEEFFGKTKEKKNKKSVLDTLFKQFKIDSYDKLAAKKIASNFSSEEINSELKRLLNNIKNLKDINNPENVAQ